MREVASSLLVKNVRVVTLSEANEGAVRSVLFQDGEVAWIGDAPQAPAAAQSVDGLGLHLAPGFIDAHAHLLWMALDKLVPHLGAAHGPRSIAQLQQWLGAKQPTAGWLVANGLSEGLLAERRLPTRWELDQVCPDRPVLLRRSCGHAAIVNSVALRLAGIGDATPDPVGGLIERSDGIPTGILRERAASLVFPKLPVAPATEVRRALQEVTQDCLALGITTAVEAAVGFTLGFEHEWKLWESVREEGGLPLRMAFMLGISAQEAQLRGLSPGPLDADWQVSCLKFFSDGTLGSRTAALHMPYCQCGSRTGMLMNAPGLLRHQVTQAADQGWQVAIHAIGDRGVDEAIEALGGAKKLPALPHRLEHLGLASLAHCARISDLQAAVVTQPSFISRMGDAFVAALGEARAPDLYRIATPIAQGVLVAGSSDAPAGALPPLHSMADAIDRTTHAGRVLGSSEALGAPSAFSLYTHNAAAVLGQPRKGALVPGALADAVLLDIDPTRASAIELRRANVAATFVRGHLAWSKDDLPLEPA